MVVFSFLKSSFLSVRLWLKNNCRVYNIGGQKEISNLELVRLICRSLQCSEELITYVKDRPGHDLRYAMDTTKISTKLGWQPRTSFEIGLQKTIMWYVEHQNWWNFMHKQCIDF